MVYVADLYGTYTTKIFVSGMALDDEFVLHADKKDEFRRERLGEGRQIAVGEPGRQANVQELLDVAIAPYRQQTLDEFRRPTFEGLLLGKRNLSSRQSASLQRKLSHLRPSISRGRLLTQRDAAHNPGLRPLAIAVVSGRDISPLNSRR